MCRNLKKLKIKKKKGPADGLINYFLKILIPFLWEIFFFFLTKFFKIFYKLMTLGYHSSVNFFQ